MANKTRMYAKEVIQEIISLYLDENKINGEIEYSNVRDFAFELYNKKHPIFTEKLYYQLVDSSTGELSEETYKNIKLSDDFWRKPQYQGRQMIDEANKLLSKTAAKPSKRQFINPNTDYLVETNKSNIPQLKLQLKPLEEQLRSYTLLIEKLEKKISELEIVIISLKEENLELKKKNDALQDSLHKFFEWSAASEIPLKNQLNTGKGRMKHVEAALRTAFSGDPSSFFSRFDKERNSVQSNVSSIQEFVKKKEPVKTGYSEIYDFE
ncbi:hypothetical protein C7121_13320 [Paenibacillus glucanolyticus]|jgi:chromosome segregation ATPase|uniref:hypothetical protein n=1 Tax=Paenibacillus glucanolyticus TaxID=59843 RepID=UPI000D1B4E5D|nr:hypothetical protein [Paenibacillus glucanolyticus]AVV57016.1 hypothetical protein C7121_13320 [Paenibacillus glucanolyticus]